MASPILGGTASIDKIFSNFTEPWPGPSDVQNQMFRVQCNDNNEQRVTHGKKGLHRFCPALYLEPALAFGGANGGYTDISPLLWQRNGQWGASWSRRAANGSARRGREAMKCEVPNAAAEEGERNTELLSLLVRQHLGLFDSRGRPTTSWTSAPFCCQQLL